MAAKHMLGWTILLAACAAQGQSAKQFVAQAVRTELAADAKDHSLWIYLDTDRTSDSNVIQWVADTPAGSLRRVLRRNGQRVSEADQKNSMNDFIHNPSAQAKQNKSDHHDDEQAAEMLSLLPNAFVWTKTGEQNGDTILHFTPDPNFSPPTWQARVFAAMEGQMMVDNAQHRIVSLKGRLIHDVKFLGGLLGDLKAGGTFDAERRQLAGDVWQITQMHVHINGYALFFKTISENEDEEKTDFQPLPQNITFAEAEQRLLGQKELALAARGSPLRR
jgi:hypothetical protein